MELIMQNKFQNEKEAFQALEIKYKELKTEIAKIIVGQDEVVRDLLISIFSNGHCLLVGVPGLAKTLMVNTLSQALGLYFKRIQFTPDLMPSDILGTEILDENILFLLMKLIELLQKHKQLFWRLCKNEMLQLQVMNIN